MDARRAKGPEAVLFSAGLHWIAFAPALACAGIAAAVQSRGTQDLVEALGLEAVPEQVMGVTGFDLDTVIVMIALVVAAGAFCRGLLRGLTTRLEVTASGVRSKRGGLFVAFSAIERVQVEQGFFGRILGYGTVNVGGRNAIGRRRQIARPYAFRKACDDQMSKWLTRDLGTDPRRKVSAA